MAYYASQVWLNELTTSKQWRILNSLHCKALRCALGEFRNKVPRPNLDSIFGRATPMKWMCYFNAKLAIVLYNLPDGPRISKKLKETSYINERTTGKAIFMDTSRLRIGKNSFLNRLQCLRRVNFDWTGGIRAHSLRINLKKPSVGHELSHF